MRLRIHGHYRIDTCGRIVRLADVNDSGLTYASPLPRLVFDPPPIPSPRQMMVMELSVVAFIVGLLIVLVLTIVPKVRQAAIAANAAAVQSAVVHRQTLTNPPATSAAVR